MSCSCEASWLWGLLTFESELGEPDIAKTSDSLKLTAAASFLHTAVGAEKLQLRGAAIAACTGMIALEFIGLIRFMRLIGLIRSTGFIRLIGFIRFIGLIGFIRFIGFIGFRV